MNIIEILKKKDTNKKYITNYKEEEIIVKVVERCGGEYDIVRVIKDDEKEYRDRGLTEFMYMSEIVNLEFEEIIDWSKVPVDTEVLVSDDGEKWCRRYFAKCERGIVYCFSCGVTSFSADIISDVVEWKYAKLYQE
jgi:hypothetical protein